MSGSPAYGTALVTGASRGIGFAIARRLGSMGLHVHGLARGAGELERSAAEIGMQPHAVDITDIAALEATVAALDIDVLVNNAGLVSAVKPLHEQRAEDIDRMIDLNLRAPLHLARLLLPGMIARGRGHVVNITSTAGRHVLPGTAPYAAAKAGVSQASAVMRYDLAGTGVRVSDIAPGRVATDIYMEAFGQDRERLQATLFDDLEMIQPDDVAAAVAAVISLPEHVDVATLELSSTDQATGGQVFAKRSIG